jgi:hypothetical protein
MCASQVLAWPSEKPELLGRHVVPAFYCRREHECPYGSAGRQLGPRENVGEETLPDRMPKVVCSGRFGGAMTELPLKTGVGPSEPGSICGAPNLAKAASGSRQHFRAQLKDPGAACWAAHSAGRFAFQSWLPPTEVAVHFALALAQMVPWRIGGGYGTSSPIVLKRRTVSQFTLSALSVVCQAALIRPTAQQAK